MSNLQLDREDPPQQGEPEPLAKDHWLRKMHGYLDWRVIGPHINNPFEMALPDRLLDSMSKNRDVVKKLMSVRCLCDGHEVMLIENLNRPLLFTDHPCLVGISRNEVLSCFEEFKVIDTIEKTVDRIQDEVREELSRRESNRKSIRGVTRTIAQIRAEREAEKREKERLKLQSGNGQARIIRK